MSKLPQVALSLAFVGTLPAAVEANYRMTYKIRERGRPSWGHGPTAPPMMPFNSGFPMSMGGNCCGNSLAPAMPMMPSQPVILPPTTSCGPALQPMVQTQLRPQQIVTYQDVPRTTIQREAVQVQVPVTTYRTVTVPQTVMQTQIQYREIPVQTMERVQQVRTILVPQQQLTYVPSGVYVPQTASAGTMLGPVAEASPTIAVPNPPQATRSVPTQTSQLPSNGGLEWQPVKPRLEPDQKTSAVEPGRTRAAGRFSPVSLPRTYDDVQTALAD